jgi:phosphoribosylglycinamide formyltransferase-1
MVGGYENKNIAIFASGAGSNAEKIIEHFTSPTALLQRESEAKVVLIVSNNPEAGVVKIAGKKKIPFLIIEKNKFNQQGYLSELNNYQIDLIILAGFLWKIPSLMIQAYQNKIINIHPALLPKFGGKGMYGSKVHQAVINLKEKESGITIHYVDEIYDHGKIIFQARCTVDENETPESLAKKIHVLEHEHYPPIIEKFL